MLLGHFNLPTNSINKLLILARLYEEYRAVAVTPVVGVHKVFISPYLDNYLSENLLPSARGILYGSIPKPMPGEGLVVKLS